MSLRIKIFVCLTVAAAAASVWSITGHPALRWNHFVLYLVAILLSSGMKVGLPKSESTASVNFPFIFLGILQLSPLQAVGLAVFSVLALCGIRVLHRFTLIQILFNLATVTIATVLTWYAYFICLPLVHHQTAPAMAIAAVAYYCANTIPIAVVVAWDAGMDAYANWRQSFAWYLPFYVVGAILAAAANYIELHFGWMTALLLIPVVYAVYRAYCAQMSVIVDRERHVKEMESLQLRTIEGLALAIEAKDQNTHRHLMRVRIYVSELGKLMGLEEPVMKALLIAAFLHDIGKLAVPEHILNKPGKLTPEEFEKMKIHPVVGADMLERVKFPYPVVPIVRSHHEAWDGSGYPDGLKGEEIPIGARILTAVDCFDALASERPYRRALPLEEAIAMVKSKSGAQFDPAVVELLEKNYQRLEILARERSDEVEPLKTDLSITKGAAPAAGFEAVQADTTSSSAQPLSTKGRLESLELIAAAGQEGKLIADLSRLLGSSLNAVETCATTSANLRRMVPFDCFAVYQIAGPSVVPHYIDGPSAEAFSTMPIPLGDGVSGWAAQSDRAIINGNPTVEANYIQSSGLFKDTSSALSVPLQGTNGSIFAVLTLYARGQTAFSHDHFRIVQAVQSKFALALENALLYRNAEADARIDHLTQLWNMRHFFEEVDEAIERAQATGESFAVAVCDLNSFKQVNDRYGHLTGNALLRAIADEFRSCCAPVDTIARMGGDEFAFLLPAMNSSDTMYKLAALHAAVQRACAAVTIGTSISGSMGVAFYPADGESAQDLLAVADRGMYGNKREFYERQGDTGKLAISEPAAAV